MGTINPAKILVLGATGKTGRRVAERLLNTGVKVRNGSRKAEPRFDWEDTTTWEAAVRGVESAHISYQPDLAFPGAPEAIKAFAHLAVASGVKKLVLLSGRGEESARRGEQAVIDSGAEWTVIRASFFNQNFSESEDFIEPLRGGVLAFPGGNVQEPFIDVDDIAEIATAALTGSKHAGQLYEVTGPRLLTFAAAVAEIAKATGHPIQYVPLTPKEYETGLIEHGVPADLATALANLFDTVLDGRNASLSDGVERALGRAPRDFAEFVKEAAARKVWARSAVMANQ